jgi:hypothetical protein
MMKLVFTTVILFAMSLAAHGAPAPDTSVLIERQAVRANAGFYAHTPYITVCFASRVASPGRAQKVSGLAALFAVSLFILDSTVLGQFCDGILLGVCRLRGKHP